MGSESKLFETLELEFCPPLDSSLLAALIADADFDSNGELTTPNQLESLRVTLRVLAAQANVSQLSEGFVDLRLASTTDETNSTLESYRVDSATNSGTSDTSDLSDSSFTSPLGFLQAALPHVPTTKLSQALSNAGVDEGEVDMWDVVASILTDESIRELEERGLEELERDEATVNDALSQVSGRKKQPKTAKRRKKQQPNKVTIVDVRQKHHALPPRGNTNPISTSAPDPWTQLTSLSTHLATLLPTHPPTFFQSYFHSPSYATPWFALRAALSATCKDAPSSPADDNMILLFRILDIVLPSCGPLNPEQHSQLMSDINLCLSATNGCAEYAVELVEVLRDLEADYTSGSLEMGVYHSKPPLSPVVSLASPREHQLPSGPPPTPPPLLKSSSMSQPSSPIAQKPNPFQWQTVQTRKIHNPKMPPSSSHIPTYVRDVNGIKVKGSGNMFGKGGKGDVGELTDARRRIRDCIQKRDEYLREAAHMWQKGNAKTRGGEIAFYYAERAREFQELARKGALDVARSVVESKRLASSDHNTLDLHGTTVAEAIVIVKETLQLQNTSDNKPLKLITGRGNHSINQTSVLKPAIKNTLIEEGWNVGVWDGGLIVRGKKAHTTCKV